MWVNIGVCFFMRLELVSMNKKITHVSQYVALRADLNNINELIELGE